MTSDIKEEFCGACIAGLTALAGAGTAGFGSTKKDRKKKKVIFWTGVTITIASIIIMFYILKVKKCQACSSSNN